MRLGYSEADERSSQDERFRQRLQLDHGFNDHYAARIVWQGDKRKGDHFEHDSVTLDNRFQFLKSAKRGWDFGARANYQLKDGDKKADKIGGGLYERIPFDNYELRMNQLLSHEVGEASVSGLNAEARFQLTRKTNHNLRFGLESFHDFGNLKTLSGYDNQSHTFGPVIKGSLPYNLSFETGYRTGLSDAAPDHNFKFFMSRSF